MTAEIYKPSAGVFGSTAFKGLLGVTATPEASTTRQRADGAQAFTKAFKEGFGYAVDVQLEANQNVNDFTLGQVGKLSFTLYEQADGVGAVTGGGKTLNFPAAASTGYAMVDGFSEPYVFEGKPAMTIRFVVVDGAGDRTLLREFVGS